MKRTICRLLIISTLVTPLAACSGGNNKRQPPPPAVGTPPPPPASGSLASRFGAAFAAIFGTAATAEPRNIGPGDIIPVDKTAEPINF